MNTLQQIVTTLTAIVMTLSAQVGNLSQSINPASQLAQVVQTPAIIQSCTSGHYDEAASCAINNLTNGSTLVAVGYSGASGASLSLSGCGLTWTKVFTDNTSPTFTWGVWTATSNGGLCSPTQTINVSHWNFLNVMEISGVNGLDVTPKDFGASYCQTGCQGPSFTTNTSGDLVIFTGFIPSAQFTYSNFSNSFNIFQQNTFNTELGGTGSNVNAYLVQNNAGSITTTYNISGSTSYAHSILMAFKPSASQTPVSPAISFFTSSPSSITSGQSSTLSWSVSGNPSPTLTLNGSPVSGLSTTVSPTQTTTYTLVATNSQGSTQSQTTVTVAQATAPTINSFSASPSSINQGQSSTLSWSVSGTPTPTLSISGIGAVSGNSTTISPSQTTTYTLTASNSAGSTNANTTVTVSVPPPDTTSPSTPTNLSATAISSSQISLSWTASTDNVGVTGYRIYRGGTQIGTSASNSYTDAGLNASTQYSYTIAAYDAAGNVSSQSSSASATTQAAQSVGGGGSPLAASVLSSSRTIDWSKSGLPATLPSGETTPNPWTPPTRAQCTTSQCNTVSGGNVTVTTINAALSSAPSGTYVLIPAGTFNLSGTINLVSNVTLRGSGAQATKISGATISTGSASGQGAWGGGSLLSGSITKGTTSVTIASGQTVPSAGRMAALSQCMTGMSAANANYTHYSGGWVTSCTGTIADPSGPWVCGGLSQCDRNGNRGETNPHFQGQVVWIPASGVSGNIVALDSPIQSPLWSTGNSASLMWMNSPGTTGAGMEDFTSVGWVEMNGCYSCWMKGLRIIFTDSAPQLTSFASRSLIANNYFAANSSGLHTIQMGSENDTTTYDSNILLLNNIFLGGYLEQNGGNAGLVMAYNYFAETPKNGSGGDSYAGDFPHNPGGQAYMLREGNQSAMSWDDDTWGAHNFSTWFRNWASGYDFVSGGTIPNPIDVGGFSRFNNVIGNVIGSPQMVAVRGSSYSSDLLGVNRNGIDATGLTKNSLMRWGNYVHCTGDSTHCQVSTGAFDNSEVPTNLSAYGVNSTPYQNSVPADRNLPASFFMNVAARPSGGTGLSWWKVCSNWASFPTNCGSYTTQPFPTFGPDVTSGAYMSGHAYDIPARVAWLNLPADPAYPGTNIRQFDQRVYQTDTGGGGGTTTYTLTSSSGTNGTITPSGVTTVNSGSSQTFTITPNSGYNVLSIMVDGVNQGAITSYTFNNVTSNHTISATFTPTPPAGGSTKFTPGQRVQTTSNLNVRATPSASGTLLGTQPSGALGTIVSGGQSADGYYWWNVNYDPPAGGLDGWSVEDYLTSYSAPIPGDLNSDGLVNSIDLSLLTSHWLQSYPAYDLNSDGIINSLDFAIMSSHWSP